MSWLKQMEALLLCYHCRGASHRGGYLGKMSGDKNLGLNLSRKVVSVLLLDFVIGESQESIFGHLDHET